MLVEKIDMKPLAIQKELEFVIVDIVNLDLEVLLVWVPGLKMRISNICLKITINTNLLPKVATVLKPIFVKSVGQVFIGQYQLLP
mgnify:CR=1 FL=1